MCSNNFITREIMMSQMSVAKITEIWPITDDITQKRACVYKPIFIQTTEGTEHTVSSTAFEFFSACKHFL